MARNRPKEEMDWTIAAVVIGVNTTVMVSVGGWMFLQVQAPEVLGE